MNLDDLRIFCIAAEAASMTDAARRLRLSVSTISRRIEALEAATGLRLFDRAPSGIRLTAHGEALRPRARQALGATEDVQRLVVGLRAGAWPEPVRVSATEPVIAEILAPALGSLLRAAPGLRIDLIVGNALASLPAREADMAVRFAVPSGGGLLRRKLPGIAMGLYTSSEYLGAVPPAALELRQARFLGYDDSFGLLPERQWLSDAGLAGQVVARMSSTRGLVAAVAAGAGVAVLPCILAEAAGLRRLPMPRPLPERPAWLVSHRDLARVGPLRQVRDWVMASFRAWRDPTRPKTPGPAP